MKQDLYLVLLRIGIFNLDFARDLVNLLIRNWIDFSKERLPIRSLASIVFPSNHRSCPLHRVPSGSNVEGASCVLNRLRTRSNPETPCIHMNTTAEGLSWLLAPGQSQPVAMLGTHLDVTGQPHSLSWTSVSLWEDHLAKHQRFLNCFCPIHSIASEMVPSEPSIPLSAGPWAFSGSRLRHARVAGKPGPQF